MLRPVTHFTREAENQSILYFKGQLDRLTATDLSSQITAMCQHGMSPVFIDMSSAGPVLAEGVHQLRDLAQQSECGFDCQAHFVNWNQAAAQCFQMYGLRLQKQCLVLNWGLAPTPSVSQSAQVLLINCPHCSARLRIRSRGRHRCPRCAQQFQSPLVGD